ncbi:MAG: hypothetical protein K8R54_06135 [Bacteroidales bacterium]|nr:hypothetical protein [Bacteroidales bacterium]
MKDTLEKLFDFLKKHRKYNKELQTRYYSSIIEPQKDTFDKVVSLLYHIANTQSQPKINNLALFYQKIYEKKDFLKSFDGFLSVIQTKKDTRNNYEGLYEGMKNQNGWGEKTSALFSKTIYHLHNNEYPKELKIWNDAPEKLIEKDIFYLPVDAVIIAIFKRIDNNQNWTFNKINKIIKRYYCGSEIEIWDDLWFWGFITQIGAGENRKMNWNLNKYWTLRESDKNPEMIDEIQQKAEFFLNILKK